MPSYRRPDPTYANAATSPATTARTITTVPKVSSIPLYIVTSAGRPVPRSDDHRSSVPGYGSPTVPSFIRPGKLAVAIAEFSVIPYSSNTGTPMPMKNSSTSGAIGAAPDEA